jgi:uncharacterized protein YcbX
MEDVVISRIVVFPIKSLDGISVKDATFLPSGALQYDREFALYDEAGRWINGKRDVRIHSIRSEYDLDARTVRLKSQTRSNWQTYHLVNDQHELENWFSSEFGIPTFLKRDQYSGFPDDCHAQGPTVISSGTIVEVSEWFSISDECETRRRLRANIELSANLPFWEDQLFGPPRHEVEFLLGEVGIFGTGPCKRCIVPVRNSITGDETSDFQKTFNAKRAATLPCWSNRARFGPVFYRLAVNTRVNRSEAGKRIRVGESCQIVGILEAAPPVLTPSAQTKC